VIRERYFAVTLNTTAPATCAEEKYFHLPVLRLRTTTCLPTNFAVVRPVADRVAALRPSLQAAGSTLPAVQHTGGFTANILAAGREALARQMATKVTSKFDAIKWRRAESPIGGPVLDDDAAAYAVCTLKDTIEAGDHWILIGLVTEGAAREGVVPMVFSRRGYHQL